MVLGSQRVSGLGRAQLTYTTAVISLGHLREGVWGAVFRSPISTRGGLWSLTAPVWFGVTACSWRRRGEKSQYLPWANWPHSGRAGGRREERVKDGPGQGCRGAAGRGTRVQVGGWAGHRHRRLRQDVWLGQGQGTPEGQNLTQDTQSWALPGPNQQHTHTLGPTMPDQVGARASLEQLRDSG